jgi:TRAP-type C4-dicarboxylate transport system permease small subunit
LSSFRSTIERLLEGVTVALMLAILIVVVLGVLYRKMGNSLVWYDEVASVLLAWLTYYAAALGALKRMHIGIPDILRAVPDRLRFALFILGEACVFAFFLVTAWYGFEVLRLLGGDTMVSLPNVPSRLTQSVIPIGALLFILAEALSLPQAWRALNQTGGAHG